MGWGETPNAVDPACRLGWTETPKAVDRACGLGWDKDSHRGGPGLWLGMDETPKAVDRVLVAWDGMRHPRRWTGSYRVLPSRPPDGRTRVHAYEDEDLE